MDDIYFDVADLHEELFQSNIRPMVVASRTGTVIEWNRAAQRCTGLSRTDVLGRPLWEVQATVAPAAIPYEKACEVARSVFLRLVSQSEEENVPWCVRTAGTILATNGILHEIHSEIYPAWIDHELVIVSILNDEEVARAHPTDDVVPEVVAAF
jgi:PAS domain-containing protein